jgi:hypothetical protein
MKKASPVIALFISLALPALAEHGRLATTDRDPWIDQAANDLVISGMVADPGKDMDQMTNLEMAQLTAQASQMIMAQADPSLLPPPMAGDPTLPEPVLSASPAPILSTAASPAQTVPSRSLQQLVEEFADELAAMGIQVDKVEQRLEDAQVRDEIYSALQKKYLTRTGTEVGGESRGFMYMYRGFGNNAAYPSMDYNAAIYMQMDLRSVPVPDVLFNVSFRFWRSIGMYYQDPIQPSYQLRWISLSGYSDSATIQGGDFYKSYTPFTLWNFNAPVYTLVDPTSFQRTRNDAEDLLYLDHGNDWKLRGLQGSVGQNWGSSWDLSSYHLESMIGVMQAPGDDIGAISFGDYFAGSQASLGFFQQNLILGATGLVLWQDAGSANSPYIVGYPDNYAKAYQVGSLWSKAGIPFDDNVKLTGGFESAFSKYNDDSTDPTKAFTDWALSAEGALEVYGIKLSTKYLNIGPYFYSPGAQTNRFSPDPSAPGYMTNNLTGLDDAAPGLLNQSPFQGINRPSYAPYDRTAENMLPYGDATPNRSVFLLGLSGAVGNKGWFQPQASVVIKAQELQPNYVLNSQGTGAIPVDSQSNTSVGRTFGGGEGALTMDFAKMANMAGKTYDIQFDYKYQTTDLGIGASPFTSKTIIGAADFNIPLKMFSPVVWSAAFEQTQSSGSEYFLSDGNPPNLGEYLFYVIPYSSSGTPNPQFTYQAMNMTRQTWAFGVKYPLSSLVDIRADCFFTNYVWTDVPSYNRTDEVWRFTYEAHY